MPLLGRSLVGVGRTFFKVWRIVWGNPKVQVSGDTGGPPTGHGSQIARHEMDCQDVVTRGTVKTGPLLMSRSTTRPPRQH